MSMFASLGKPAQEMLTMWSFLLVWCYTWLLMRMMERRMAAKTIVYIIAEESLILILFFGMMDPQCALYARLPVAVCFAVFGLMTAGLAVRIVQAALWRRSRLTAMSVKESFDNLPTGICFYTESGRMVLVNRTMASLAHMLHEEADGNKLWALIEGGQGAELVEEADAAHPILKMPDGSTWGFYRNDLTVDRDTLYEIDAFDVSEEAEKHQALRESERRARAAGARLKALSRSIGIVTMEREALAAKARIHDQLGLCLLMTRRYLAAPGEIDRSELLGAWRLNAALLGNREPELWEEPYYGSSAQAEALGVTLQITGTLPEEEPLQSVVDTAIAAQMMNVLRHTDGTEVRVLVKEDNNCYQIELTNDGEPPREPVRESGGLANLRREAEAAGCTMTVQSAPFFKLTLVRPKGEQSDE